MISGCCNIVWQTGQVSSVTADGRIALNKLNEQVARDLGVKVSELAVKDETAPTVAKAEASTTKKADAKKVTAKK